VPYYMHVNTDLNSPLSVIILPLVSAIVLFISGLLLFMHSCHVVKIICCDNVTCGHKIALATMWLCVHGTIIDVLHLFPNFYCYYASQ